MDAFAELQICVAQGIWGYHPAGPQSTEPAALACIALSAQGSDNEAMPLANWLADLQHTKGSVGVTADQVTPAWPTSLAMLAWQAVDTATGTSEFADSRRRALNWAVQDKGKAAPQQDHIGHDTTLLGWSWAAATHSWLEPTCLFVLALKAAGQSEHLRTREGVRIIVDRQLESGGCNYGNTSVLGQATLPHVQPTGLAMLAIADESMTDPRINRSLEYLERAILEPAATASLCYAVIGLSAHSRRPANADRLLGHAFQKDSEQKTLNCYKLALLSLASSTDLSWLPSPESLPSLSVLNS